MSAMFLNDAAAGVERKGRRLRAVFGIEYRPKNKGFPVVPGSAVSGQKINHDNVTLPMGPNHEGGIISFMDLRAYLSGQVKADVQDLV
jgi:hypothetical protein